MFLLTPYLVYQGATNGSFSPCITMRPSTVQGNQGLKCTKRLYVIYCLLPMPPLNIIYNVVSKNTWWKCLLLNHNLGKLENHSLETFTRSYQKILIPFSRDFEFFYQSFKCFTGWFKVGSPRSNNYTW